MRRELLFCFYMQKSLGVEGVLLTLGSPPLKAEFCKQLCRNINVRVAAADQQSVNCFVNAVFPNASVNSQTELTAGKSTGMCSV